MADVRLIDANAWIAEHCEGCNYIVTGICNPSDPVCGAVELMNEAPTIDAVPVVRCKDCKFAEPYERMDGEKGYCCKFDGNSFTYGQNWDRQFNPVREAHDFCSYGERKDDETH